MLANLISTPAGTHIILGIRHKFMGIGGYPHPGTPGCAVVFVVYEPMDLPAVRTVCTILRERGGSPSVVITEEIMQISYTLSDLTPSTLQRVMGESIFGTPLEYAERIHLTSITTRKSGNKESRIFRSYYERDKSYLLMVMDSSAREEPHQTVRGQPLEVFPLRDIGTIIETFIE